MTSGLAMVQAVSERSLTAGAPVYVELVFYQFAQGQVSFFSRLFFYRILRCPLSAYFHQLSTLIHLTPTASNLSN